ncbi:glycosyltransferase [Gammaproteobacteria bacterium]|nr:glycosyltransferase [Gammaproteobacteria bacterium]
MIDKNNNLKVLIMAGGTGGHIFPALSIAEYLLSKGVQVEWLGTKKGMESQVIGNTKIPMHYISIGGLRGKNIWKKLLAPFVVVVAVIQSVSRIIKIKPNCVLGMGGFVTGPGGCCSLVVAKKIMYS